MKKGISLIVLVITIIVLAILAGAVIISLSNQNVITKAGEAATAADRANAKYAVTMAYAEAVSKANDGKAYKSYANGSGVLMTNNDYIEAVKNAGFDKTLAEDILDADKFNDATGTPCVKTN